LTTRKIPHLLRELPNGGGQAGPFIRLPEIGQMAENHAYDTRGCAVANIPYRWYPQSDSKGCNLRQLKDFYDARVASDDEGGFLKQVGHTESGWPITPLQFDRMVQQVHGLLNLCSDDRLLDLCCGNGVISARLADTAAEVVGIDLSPELIRVANTHQARANTTFVQGDMRALAEIPELRGKPFSKVLMHAALQHFSPNEFEPILRSVQKLCGPLPVFVFGFIPEKGKQKYLFNTPRRRLQRLWLRGTGQDNFGHWWQKRSLEEVCDRLGFDCSFEAVDSHLAAASHRFNMRITVT
jgi:2-polyprenyl-3-methyl-5-hydroxy-6-metoxy-1,4-benzoquinol methylase